MPLSLCWPEFAIPHIATSQVLKLQAQVPTPGLIHFISKFTFTMCTLTLATLGDVGRWGREQMWFGLRIRIYVRADCRGKAPAGRPGSHSHHRWQLVLRAHTTLSHLQQQTNRVQMSYGNKDKASFAVKLPDTLHLKATPQFYLIAFRKHSFFLITLAEKSGSDGAHL